MEYDKILSTKFRDLNAAASEYSKIYTANLPFPHISINNFFDENFLKKVLQEFPNLSAKKKSESWNNKNEVKFLNDNYETFGPYTRFCVDFLNSKIYLNFLQTITSIKEKLISDPYLSGGGLHEIKKGGLLKVHTDFNKHPSLNLDRRINVLIYLNENWKEDYGGNLELWDQKMENCIKKISPEFNKMVIFSTTDFSNHGHPEPLNCLENLSRKSLALYYFSNGRPKNEVHISNQKVGTLFKSRKGFDNEVYQKKTSKFKETLRKLKIYQFLKEFEKKYIRKKRL